MEEDPSEADGVSEEGGNVAEDRSADSSGPHAFRQRGDIAGNSNWLFW